MGLSMALHEESVRDHRFGRVVTQDLATYHISSHADVPDIDAIWLDDVDEHSNSMGSRGAGPARRVRRAADGVTRRPTHPTLPSKTCSSTASMAKIGYALSSEVLPQLR
jgi:hypothetical protein